MSIPFAEDTAEARLANFFPSGEIYWYSLSTRPTSPRELVTYNLFFPSRPLKYTCLTLITRLSQPRASNSLIACSRAAGVAAVARGEGAAVARGEADVAAVAGGEAPVLQLLRRCCSRCAGVAAVAGGDVSTMTGCASSAGPLPVAPGLQRFR